MFTAGILQNIWRTCNISQSLLIDINRETRWMLNWAIAEYFDKESFDCNYLGLISPTFYEQLLRAQIPKAQQSCLTWQSFLRFWDLRA